jgi:hypothetical protein
MSWLVTISHRFSNSKELLLTPLAGQVPKQGCQIFLGTTYQKEKNTPDHQQIHQLTIKYTK